MIHPIDDENSDEYKNFYRWFKIMLNQQTESCFERDVLRENKYNLWISWYGIAKEYDKQ